MKSSIGVLLLSLGGILGVNARYWLSSWMARWADPAFPWATFVINVSGSFAIGFLSTYLTAKLPHPHLRLLMLVGFLGGYTTFSTFALESLVLWERGRLCLSVAYVLGSVGAGLGAVLIGVVVARGLTDISAQAEAAPKGAPIDRLETPSALGRQADQDDGKGR